MTLSEYISMLEAIKAEHGDLPVKTNYGHRIMTPYKPSVEYMSILNKRESVDRYWRSWEDKDRTGERVIAI